MIFAHTASGVAPRTMLVAVIAPGLTRAFISGVPFPTTVRTASMHEPTPSRVLRVLNDAILWRSDADRFCTVLYAHGRPVDGGYLLRLSAAGHPLHVETGRPIYSCRLVRLCAGLPHA